MFQDRADAGRQLAQRLRRYADAEDVLVLGLPRGGVPVAYEVARELDAPLDVVVVRKLGVPGREELAMGAVASGGVRVLNEDVLRLADVSEEAIAAASRRETEELGRRERLYRNGREGIEPEGRTVILVDDGLATGASMRAAALALAERGAARVVVAVPVAARETCKQIEPEVDEVVCAATPEPFLAVGAWYEDFSQTSDDQVRELLGAAVPG